MDQVIVFWNGAVKKKFTSLFENMTFIFTDYFYFFIYFIFFAEMGFKI
jgi:hypothetical protein